LEDKPKAIDRMYDALSEGAGVELCQCELSGDLHIVYDGKGCEMCDKGRRPFTPDNIEKAFKFYQERVDKERNKS
jgi:hypothetical protein